MESNQIIKKSFWKDVKNIVIIVLIALLITIGVLFFRSIANLNQIYDLQSQIQNLNTSSNNLSSQIEENKVKISELENNNNVLQKEKEALVTEKTSFEAEIQQLKHDNATLTSQITSLKKSSKANNATTSSSSSNTSSSSEVGVWITSVTTTEFSTETHTSKEVTYTTTYEFKNNGDFCMNGDKVGTYKDSSIFFKDSNDTNYRTASYKLDNSILYVNLYQSNTDICVSTDFYKCEKK